MVVREDLVASAVSFLQDPSVANAPLDKRIAFLQSKNLTQEEIDASLARVGEDTPSTSAPPTPASSYTYRQTPPPSPGYGPYQQYWQPPPPPPELPRRDWRDYFIMATVMGGISYGLYFTAKRYLLPLIAPPTPPQLEQDKASIDESFTRAFALLDQVSTDTESLKKSEESRTQRLDTALSELESVLASLKDADRRRDDDARRTMDEVRSLRDLIPKSLDAQKEATESRLRDLGAELRSLKTLLGNRVGSGAGGARGPDGVRTPGATAGAVPAGGANMFGAQGNVAVNSGAAASSAAPAQPSSTAGAGADAVDGQAGQGSGSSAAQPDRTLSSSPYGRLMNGRATIPAWQMAAQKKSQGAEVGEKKDTSESGTVSEATA